MKRSPIGWILPAIAGVAATLAILDGAYLTVAIPAATLAVIAACLVFVGGWRERAEPPVASEPEELLATDRMRRAMRSSLRAGRMGREEILAALDRIDRRFRDPQLSPPSLAEVDRINGLSSEEFLAYVRGRLDRLEEVA